MYRTRPYDARQFFPLYRSSHADAVLSRQSSTLLARQAYNGSRSAVNHCTSHWDLDSCRRLTAYYPVDLLIGQSVQVRRSGGGWGNAIVCHASGGLSGVEPEIVVRFPCGGWKTIRMPLVARMVRPHENRDVSELMHHHDDSDPVEDSEAVSELMHQHADSDPVEDSEAVALDLDSSACSDSELVHALLEIESSFHADGMLPVRHTHKDDDAYTSVGVLSAHSNIGETEASLSTISRVAAVNGVPASFGDACRNALQRCVVSSDKLRDETVSLVNHAGKNCVADVHL